MVLHSINETRPETSTRGLTVHLVDFSDPERVADYQADATINIATKTLEEEMKKHSEDFPDLLGKDKSEERKLFIENYLKQLKRSADSRTAIVPDIISGRLALIGEAIPVWAEPIYAAKFLAGCLGLNEVKDLSHLQSRWMLMDPELANSSAPGHEPGELGYKMVTTLLHGAQKGFVIEKPKIEEVISIVSGKSQQVEKKKVKKEPEEKLTQIEKIERYLDAWASNYAVEKIGELYPKAKETLLTKLTPKMWRETGEKERREDYNNLVEYLKYTRNRIMRIIKADGNKREWTDKTLRSLFLFDYELKCAYVSESESSMKPVVIIPIFNDNGTNRPDIVGYTAINKEDADFLDFAKKPWDNYLQSLKRKGKI